MPLGLPIEFPHWKSYSIPQTHYKLNQELVKCINNLTDESLQDALKSSDKTYTIISLDQYANSKILIKHKNNTQEFVSFKILGYNYFVYDHSGDINHYSNWLSVDKLTSMVMFRLMEHPEHEIKFKVYVSKYKITIEKFDE